MSKKLKKKVEGEKNPVGRPRKEPHGTHTFRMKNRLRVLTIPAIKKLIKEIEANNPLIK